MLNPCQQKRVHPLGKLVNINIYDVNCQYFVWPPSLSRTAVTLLGMEFTRASQVATGMLFHSSMTTSQSWQIFRLCAPPPSAWGSPKDFILDSSLKTWWASPSPLPSASSVKQWLSWSCVWVIVMLELCPTTRFLEGRVHALLQYFMVHVGVHCYLNEM